MSLVEGLESAQHLSACPPQPGAVIGRRARIQGVLLTLFLDTVRASARWGRSEPVEGPEGREQVGGGAGGSFAPVSAGQNPSA